MNYKLQILYIGNNLQTRDSLPTGIHFLSEKLKKEGIKVKTASEKKNKIYRFLDMFALVAGNYKKADLVLIDTYSTSNFWYTYYIAILCQKLKLKYIPVLHGGNLPERIKRSPRASKTIFNNAWLNIAPSQFLLEEFRKSGFPSPVYIPNAIKIKHYKFRLRKKLTPKLLWVRAFSEIYNPLLAIKVLQLLIQEFPEATLTMVGPAKDNSFEVCRQYVEKYDLPVEFSGKLKKEKWLSLSDSTDIFINTSNIDNTPVSLIEAMALGLPVVSTDVGGIPYLVRHSEDAILVPPNDPEKMAAAVEKIITNPLETQKRILAGRKKAESFEWEIVKKKWFKIFDSLNTE